MDTHWISYKQSGGTTLPDPKLYKVYSPVFSVGKTQGQVYQAKTCISSVTLVSSCGLIYISWADDQWGQNGIICGWLI